MEQTRKDSATILECLLRDEEKTQQFGLYLESVHGAECLSFHQAVEVYEHIPDITERQATAIKIWDTYLSSTAPSAIGTTFNIKKTISESLSSGNIDLFEEAQRSQFKLMVVNFLLPFEKSRFSAGQQHYLNWPSKIEIEKALTSKDQELRRQIKTHKFKENENFVLESIFHYEENVLDNYHRIESYFQVDGYPKGSKKIFQGCLTENKTNLMFDGLRDFLWGGFCDKFIEFEAWLAGLSPVEYHEHLGKSKISEGRSPSKTRRKSVGMNKSKPRLSRLFTRESLSFRNDQTTGFFYIFFIIS